MSKYIARVHGLLRPKFWSQLVTRLRTTNEELTGLDEVLKAQEKAEEERKLLEVAHDAIVGAKGEIKKVEKEWEMFQNQRVGYYQADERDRNPLMLQTLSQKEIELSLKKKELQDLLDNHELEERNLFQQLSETMWDIHRKEIAHQERVKAYNSFASTARGFVGLIGALLGFFGSSWIMRKKISKLESEIICLKSATDLHVEAYLSVSSELSEVKEILAHYNQQLIDVHTALMDKQATDGLTDLDTNTVEDLLVKETDSIPDEFLVVAMVTKFCCMLFVTCKSIIFSR